MSEQWQSGDPCADCGCDAFMDTPAGRLHAHLAECPRLDVVRLRERLEDAVEQRDEAFRLLRELTYREGNSRAIARTLEGARAYLAEYDPHYGHSGASRDSDAPKET